MITTNRGDKSRMEDTMNQITLDDMIIELNPWQHMKAMFKPLPLMITEDATKTARIEAYNDRKQARIDSLYAAAAKRNLEANRRIEAGFNKLDAIPFGQPVHGSRDRNYRRKASDQIDSGYRLSKEADHFERKAEAAENNHAISADDPMAIEKLTAKLDDLQRLQEKMKDTNKACRHAGEPAHYPGWALQNNNANIRRIKDRIEELKNKAEQEAETWTGEGWTAETDTDDNRIRVYFDSKPDEATRTILKGYGFRWSPKAGAWQRQDTRAGRSAMRMISAKLNA